MDTTSNILIIDDHPGFIYHLGLTLGAAGYHTLTACDGIEALDVLRLKRVDLILADIAMPRLNGYQLYEEVRSNPDWKTIPFIFLTARNLNSDIDYGKQIGVDEYLTKPVQTGDLLSVIRQKLMVKA